MGSSPDRLFFTLLNACWGASIGAAVALLVHRAGAWSGGEPSQALLADGALVLFGVGFMVASLLRGRAITLRGLLIVAGSGAGLYVAWTLAISAPGWALAWVAASLAGLLCGLFWPLSEARGR
jgi:hypothetical protein